MSDDDTKDLPDLADGIPLEDLTGGAPVAGRFDGEAVVVVDDGGRLCAWSGKCTHMGAPLGDGIVVDGQLRCPWHHARFSLESGEAVAAPAFEPLERYDIETRDGRLFVTGKSADTAPPATGTSPGRVVIVGGGAAGHACAEMLARHGFGASVTVVSDDADPPYDRTVCSKQYLIGMAPRDDAMLAGGLYDHGGPVLRVSRAVRSIDPQARKVVLDDDSALPYDALVLATGAEPIRLDLPGFDRPNVHVLRTLRDADALIAAADAGKRAVVVGASFIGLEAAASLTQRDVAVQVVATDAIPLEKIVGAPVGSMIREVHEEKGVRFHLGRKPASYDGRVLTLDDGSCLEADFVVVGVGVKPRTSLAEAAGLEVASKDEGGGVVVDERLATSVPGIHAIGDIARYPDRHVGKPVRVEHWVHAQRQGQFVARRLMGLAERYDDLPFFWSAHFDTGLRYHGHVDTIEKAEVDGSITGRDFTIRFDGAGSERAFVTCNRDLPALQVEAAWEADRDAVG